MSSKRARLLVLADESVGRDCHRPSPYSGVMSRHTTFRWTLNPTTEQERALRRHAGASRFAFNQCRRFVVTALDERARLASLGTGRAESSSTCGTEDVLVPLSGFDLIKAFNRWKHSPAAGDAPDGTQGLAWKGEVCAQVFEEAAVDCGRALAAWSASRAGKRAGRPVGFPSWKRRGRCRDSFRIRNKITKGAIRKDAIPGPARHAIRVGGDHPRSVSLPVIGTLRVHDDTRALRRMIAKGRSRILFATISRHGNSWIITLNCEAADFHPSQHWTTGPQAPWVGLDRGISTFAALADEDGVLHARIQSPKPLRAGLRALRRESKTLSRRQAGSGRHLNAKRRVSARYARIADIRRTFLHNTSTRLLKTHGKVAIEDLNIAGIIANRHLSRAVADLGWGEFARQLAYKANWHHAQLQVIDRWYPSSKTCSTCGYLSGALPLSVRTWTCPRCLNVLDRDDNAAINLAVHASRSTSAAKGTVAPK